MTCRFFLWGFCFLLFSCAEKPEPKNITPAVYHWKSVYQPSEKAGKTLEKLHIQKQFIRFFDIDFDKDAAEAIPKGIVRFKESPQFEIVPVVYVSNRTFNSLNQKQVDSLAVKTAIKIKDIAAKNDILFSEIQLDCDWTKSTQNAYFAYLNRLKEAFDNKIKLTATLRLHQIKFKEQTGVPPVERGTLMLYNVGDWTNILTPNSLFDPEIIDQYIYRLPEYPLPLDIALPVYEQTIVFRNNKFHTYFKNFSKLDLRKTFNVESDKSGRLLICQENCEFRNHSFRKGDAFRHERVDFKTLNKVKKAILRRVKNKDLQILLFHLDDESLNNFTVEQYSELLRN